MSSNERVAVRTDQLTNRPAQPKAISKLCEGRNLTKCARQIVSAVKVMPNCNARAPCGSARYDTSIRVLKNYYIRTRQP